MADIVLLAVTLMGPFFIGAIGLVAGGPKLAAHGGLVTAIYLGLESDIQIYNDAMLVLLAAIGIIAGMRLGSSVVRG